MTGNGTACTTSFLLGALVGAAVGLLYAPRAGSETREMLAKKTRHLRNKAQNVYNKAENVYHDGKETARTFVNEATDLARGRA